MNNLNSVLLEGNLVRDPEVRSVSTGANLCSFTIATNRMYKSGNEFKKEVSYIDVTAWGKTAEICAKSLTKGSGVRVIGSLKQNMWKGSDGKNHSKIVVNAMQVEIASKSNTQKSQPPENVQQTKTSYPVVPEESFEDGIPF